MLGQPTIRRNHTDLPRGQLKAIDDTNLHYYALTDNIRQRKHTKNRTYHMQSVAVDDAVLLHEISGYCNRGKIQALGGKLRCKFISLGRQLVTKALKGQQDICHPQCRVWLGWGGNGWDFELLIPKAWRMERLLEKNRTRQTTLGHPALSNYLRTCSPNLVLLSMQTLYATKFLSFICWRGLWIILIKDLSLIIIWL